VKPGIYHDIPIEQYHADPSTVSKSGLDLIARTPLHYWAAHLDPDRPEREDTPAFVEGRAVHALALEGREVFDRQFAVAPRVDRRTKAGKEDWQAWADAHASHTILTAEQSERVEAMHAGLQRHEGARRYLGADGDAEVSIYWTDEATGVACRCRPDKIVPIPGTDEVVLVDLKTTRDGLDDETISRTLARYRYHALPGSRSARSPSSSSRSPAPTEPASSRCARTQSRAGASSTGRISRPTRNALRLASGRGIALRPKRSASHRGRCAAPV
jgi:hypothetical protein